MSVAAAKQKVHAAVDARMPEFKPLLGDVIRIPTDNPPGYTIDCIQFLAGYLEDLGVPADLYEPQPAFQSLVSFV